MTAPRVIKRFAYRNTDGDDIRIFRGAPVTFEVSLDESIDLTGCTSLRLDIRESATDTNSPLATSEEVNPTGTSFQFTFSSGETNHDVSSGWLVLSAYYPEGVGSSDDNLDPLLVSSLTFVDHNSSRLAPSPPNAAVAMTQTEADARYLFNTGDSQILIGRYASGTGVLQSITLGANIYLSNSGVLSAGVAGSVPWGNIIGTITDQSDLVTFVNTKQPSGASLTSIGSFSSVGSIPYYSAANIFSPITIGSGLSFAGGILSSTVTGSSGGSISDGDKGDITVSGGGSVWTVDSSAITYDKIQNVSSEYVLGRTGVGAGVVQEILTSSFGRSLWTGADAAATRTLLNVDVAGTDNSTNVTLAGTPDYITIAGQVITRNPIDLSSDVSGALNATSIADGSVSNTEFQYLNGGTGNIQSQIDATNSNFVNYQPFNSSLTGLSNYSSTGIVTYVGSNTFASREIQGTTNEITVSNGNGSAGNPVIGLSTGIDAAKIGDGSVSSAEFQYLNGVSSNIQTQLASKANTGDLGSAAYVDSSEFVSATNTVGANLFFAGADGEAGLAPSFRLMATGDLPDSAVTPGSYTNTNLTVDSKGRIIAASNGVAGSGGGGSWGSISGTLSDQTDLYSSLTGKQPLDSDLTAIAALTTTSFGRGFLEHADANATKVALGLNNVENTAISTWAGSSNIHYIGNIYTKPVFESGISVGITGSQSGVVTFNDANSSYYADLSVEMLTANRRLTLPNETGILATRDWATGQFLESSISDNLDSISSTQGVVLYRGSSGWVALTPGVSGQFLQTNGSSANPVWATSSGGGTPGGSNAQLQYNNGGAFAGISGATTNGTSVTLVDPILTNATAYAVVCGGTSSSTPLQSVASVGTAGQVLTSNGAGALPTFQSVGGTGTVTSVAASFTGGIVSISGSPITSSGTLALTVAGTSGGIPYFSGASTWASSAELGSNQIVVGGGAGAAPVSRTQFTVSSTGMVSITTGTLVDGTSGLEFVATMPTTITASYCAVDYQITGAGSSSFSNFGINVDYLVGYTGNQSTAGIRVSNANAGTGSVISISGASTVTANIGITATCGAASGTSGSSIGVNAVAHGGNVNVGILGRAVGVKNSATNIGVIGNALNTGTSPIQIGGYFGLNSADPTYASAALICDNGSTTSDIFVARDNGSAVFTIANGGAVTTTNTVTAPGLRASSASGGIGYSSGAGGSVNQATSRTTGVTLNRMCGEITLVSAAGSATAASFTVTNSAMVATDIVILNQKSGTDKYMLFVTAKAAGSFEITFMTTGGTTTEQPVIGYAIIKGVT